jgi:hypothetical protein
VVVVPRQRLRLEALAEAFSPGGVAGVPVESLLGEGVVYAADFGEGGYAYVADGEAA